MEEKQTVTAAGLTVAVRRWPVRKSLQYARVISPVIPKAVGAVSLIPQDEGPDDDVGGIQQFVERLCLTLHETLTNENIDVLLNMAVEGLDFADRAKAGEFVEALCLEDFSEVITAVFKRNLVFLLSLFDRWKKSSGMFTTPRAYSPATASDSNGHSTKSPETNSNG